MILPNETWTECFEFVPRYDLGRSISLVNAHFHALALPIMHENCPRKIFQLSVYATEEDGMRAEKNEQKCSIRSLFSQAKEPSCIDLAMEPPKNVVAVKLMYICSVNAGVANLLQYFHRHRLIRDVIFYEDRRQTLPKLAQLYPNFFTDNTFPFEISVEYDCEIREQKRFELAMPRKFFSHPALLNFPFTLNTAVGDRARSCGPLIHWLHWRSVGRKFPQRVLQIFILGQYKRTFVEKFISALIERFVTAKKQCPYLVRFLASREEWADLLEQPEQRNSRTGEMLHFAKMESMYKMARYEISRRKLEI